MSEKSVDSNEPLIDPDVKEEVSENRPEDPFFTEYHTNGESGEEDEKVGVTSRWIGDENGDNWKPKTQLNSEQIIALTQARMLTDSFEELQAIEPMIDQTINNLEQYVVSLQGMSREQQVSVLKSMHSGESMEENKRTEKLMQMFSASQNNDD